MYTIEYFLVQAARDEHTMLQGIVQIVTLVDGPVVIPWSVRPEHAPDSGSEA